MARRRRAAGEGAEERKEEAEAGAEGEGFAGAGVEEQAKRRRAMAEDDLPEDMYFDAYGNLRRKRKEVPGGGESEAETATGMQAQAERTWWEFGWELVFGKEEEEGEAKEQRVLEGGPAREWPLPDQQGSASPSQARALEAQQLVAAEDSVEIELA